MEATVERKTKPDVLDFHRIIEEGLAMGYRIIGGQYMKEEFWRHDIALTEREEHKPTSDTDKKREVGLICHHPSGYKAKAWTSFVWEDQAYKDQDHGFVLIENEHGHVVYWADLTRRTKNFADNFISWMRVCMERVMNRPQCDHPECRWWMHIEPMSNGGLGWECVNHKLHRKEPVKIKSIDLGLSVLSQDFLKRRRRMRHLDRNDPRRKTERSEWGFGNRVPHWIKRFRSRQYVSA